LDCAHIARWLERRVELGEIFSAGETIEFGWMTLRVSLSEDGMLQLEEPDLKSLPIDWVPGIAMTLQSTRVQKDVAASVGAEDALCPANIRQSILIGADVSPGDDSLTLDRVEPEASDSGWFVGRATSILDYNRSDSLKRISIYEAVITLRRIIPYLALPPGSRISLGQSSVRFERDGQKLPVAADSLVARWSSI